MFCQKDETKEKLSSVPLGEIKTVYYSSHDEKASPLVEKIDVQCSGRGMVETYDVYPGIEISFVAIYAEQASFKHEPMRNIMEINHCHHGRIGLTVDSGDTIYLGPNDFSIHTLDICSDSEMSLPLGYYEGITVCIDLQKLMENPPEILKDVDITDELLYRKFCKNKAFTTLSGNENSERLFSGLYDVPKKHRVPYFKVKIQELLLYLYDLEFNANQGVYQFPSDQIEIIKKIHELLIENLDKRFTIEDLSKKFLMNTTTLKSVFKSVYGVSIAAHVKEHRLEKAAFLLRETDESISEIARTVGYESQSKFTSAFRETYQMLPTDYRKQVSPSKKKDIL